MLAAACGGGLTVWLWQDARAREQARREAEFERQSAARHAVIRETLAGYEDCLLALKLLFTYGGAVNRDEFAAAVRQQLSRHPGFLGLQWAPAVTANDRAAWEKAHAAEIGAIGIRERGHSGADVRAGARDIYYPIFFAEPLDANRHVLGSDAAASPLRADIARARDTGTCVISGLLKLVYETGPNDGVIMICPVQAPGNEGVLLGVFRVADLFTQPWNRAPGARLDVLFLDEATTRPDRRTLYAYVVDGGPAPSEAAMRAGLHRDIPLAIAGRPWRVLYRPAAGLAGAEMSVQPTVLLIAGLLITSLGTGYLASRLRRAELVERVVHERTIELSESRRQLSGLMQALPGMAFRCRYKEGKLTVLFASDGCTALTGWTPDEFTAGTIQFRDLVYPGDLEHVRTTTLAALDAHRDYEVEFRIRTRDARERWVLSRGRGVYDLDGRLDFFEGLIIDVTAQKQSEQDRLTLERRLLEGQKLESLGLLAGGIAHDFNNLLVAVIGNSNLLRLDPAVGGANATAKLDAIEQAAQRAADLCRQMLAYAGKGRFVVEPADLSLLVENLVPLLDVSVAKQAHLRLVLARNLPPVSADATQLRQIVMNLVLNAGDAIGSVTPARRGEITLTTGVMSADATMLRACRGGAELAAGEFVFLEVRDNGCGMTPEVREKIFDPFFTTKFAGRGLGLAAVLGIVRSHGGALHVQTTPGTGSAFRLLFPAAAGAPAQSPPPAIVAGSWRFTGRVLIIDDDTAVLRVAADLLNTGGATVQTAGDALTGIETFRADPGAFDVVLLDLQMPGVDGGDALKALRAIRADARVLIISGFSESDVTNRLAGDRGPLRFLHKPFTRASLTSALRELVT